MLIAKDSSLLNASLKTARFLENKGDIDAAILIYKDIIQENPYHHIAAQRLNSIFTTHKRYKEGIAFLEMRINVQPNNYKLFSELGEYYYLNGQEGVAFSIWNDASTKFKNNRSYYRQMLTIYSKYGLDDSIDEILDDGRKRFGKAFLSYESGVYYQAKGAYDKSMDQFILNLIHEPRQAGMIERRILLMSDKEEAIAIIDKKLKKFSKIFPLKLLNITSEYHFKKQNYSEAYEYKLKWVLLNKKGYKELIKFGNQLRDENQFKFSMDAYKFILKHSAEPRMKGKALLEMAKTFEKQIVPLNQDYLIPYFYDDNIFFKNPFEIYSLISEEHLETSLELYDSILVSLDDSPILSEAYFKLGKIHYKILQDFDKAYLLLNQSLSKNDDKSFRKEVLISITDVLIAQGQIGSALELVQKELGNNISPQLNMRKILIHFLKNNADYTLDVIDSTMLTMESNSNLLNDLMELKSIIEKYYSDSSIDQTAFTHFLKAENYLRMRKVGDAINELIFINNNFNNSKVLPLANMRLSLLYFKLNDFQMALETCSLLQDTDLYQKALIFSAEIYEKKLLEKDKALQLYMKILNEYPSSVFSEPVRYHIRSIQKERG